MAILLPFFGTAQDSLLLSNTQISLLTCDPGSSVESLFGHSAIRVKDGSSLEDIVFNYGTFDFDEPNFLLKFLRGKLPYKLAVGRFHDFMREYQYYHRGVREQVLNINNAQKKELLSFLYNNAQPENAAYMYDFFFDNCSSRIRDVFEKTVKYTPNYTSPQTLTYRDQLHQNLTGHPWTKLGIDMIIGSIADKNSDAKHQMFLPHKLHDILDNVKTKDGKLLAPSKYIMDFAQEREARRKRPIWSPSVMGVALMILLLLLTYFKKHEIIKWLAKFWYFLTGLSGIIILLMWFGTDHIATKLNWNILWLCPLNLLLLKDDFKYRSALVRIVGGLILLCLVCSFAIPQDMPIAIFMSILFYMFYYEWHKYNSKHTLHEQN
jgi:hypothetical protein